MDKQLKDKLARLKDSISRLSDRELLEMVEQKSSDYRRETLDYAAKELETRGIQISLKASLPTELNADVETPFTSRRISALMNRYKDAYIVARVTNGFGGMIKGIGITMAILLVLIGFVLISNGQAGDATFAMGVVTIIFGVIAGIWFYIVGMLVSAQGQILTASLDSAVNNSPFLTNEHRAKIMSLPEA